MAARKPVNASRRLMKCILESWSASTHLRRSRSCVQFKAMRWRRRKRAGIDQAIRSANIASGRPRPRLGGGPQEIAKISCKARQSMRSRAFALELKGRRTADLYRRGRRLSGTYGTGTAGVAGQGTVARRVAAARRELVAAGPSTVDYLEFTFNAPASTLHRVWVRMRAAVNNNPWARLPTAASARDDKRLQAPGFRLEGGLPT